MDVPHVAVWSVGYEATSIWWKQGAAMALPDRAANLLPLLANEPALARGNIILVGHSLGGLVIEAILELGETKAHFNAGIADFVRRVRRVVFISTPHRGSDQASLVNGASAILLPRKTTAGLSRNDAELRRLNTWFRGFSLRNSVESLVLYETKPVPFAGVPNLGGIVVKPDSADPGLSPSDDVIPLPEDHYSIVAPKNRDAETYVHIKRFVGKPISTRHGDVLIAEAIETVGQRVEARSDQLSAQLSESHREFIQKIESAQMRRSDEKSIRAGLVVTDSPLASEELERRLWTIRRSRYVLSYDAAAACKRLLGDIQKGDLSSASGSSRRIGFAWLARLLSAKDIEAAKEALSSAEDLGDGWENTVARAFIQAYGGDKAGAQALLSSLRTPASQSATFMIAAHDLSPAEGLAWLSIAGLAFAELDPDGRFAVLQRRLSTNDIHTGLSEAAVLSEADFHQTPMLLHVAAMLHLGAAVHTDLRAGAFEHLPISLVEFPLDTTSAGKAHIRSASDFFARASVALESLGLHSHADLSSDYALWLGLREPSTRDLSLKTLSDSMSDARHRLRRLTMALQFGLKPDLAAIEAEIDQETARTGGKSLNAALARFGIARTKGSAGDIADYVGKHRKQLAEYFNPDWITAFEVETLANAGRVEDARKLIGELRSDAISQSQIDLLHRIVDDAAGSDPLASAEKQYLTHKQVSDLLNLHDLLRARSAWQQLTVYAKELYEQTHATAHGLSYVEALYRVGRHDDVIAAGAAYPDLASDSQYKHMAAWSHYHRGDLLNARSLLDETRLSSEPSSVAALDTNLAVASGDWNSLSIFVEAQWARREALSAEELLSAGQLAQHIGSSRHRDLIEAAAAKANDDPAILVACYSVAIESGWENNEKIHSWFAVAAEKSGPDGPVQKFDIKKLLDPDSDWARREEETWNQLTAGTLPMYVGAQLLSRSTFQMFTLAAYGNVDEPDPRRKAVLFSFSGKRPVIQVSSKSAAFDVSVLVNLDQLGLLEKAFALFESVSIAHRTMAWFLEERQRLQFHQPSQVKSAKALRVLLDSNRLGLFEETEQSDARLEQEVGTDLASLLVAARAAAGESRKRVVVRPYPLYRLRSWMSELADVSGYEGSLAGTIDVVAALRKEGRMTAAEEERALKYLELHEKRWPHEPNIPPGSILLLDDIAVSHLQHLGLLDRLKAAGFDGYLTRSEVDRRDALIRHEAYIEHVTEGIGRIRGVLNAGIASGKVRLGRLPEGDEDSPLPLKQHPTTGLFAVEGIDCLIADDRYINQHGNITLPSGAAVVHTTVDLLEAMRVKGSITDAEFGDALTTLRRAGHLLIPILPTELLLAIETATVANGRVLESGELRAIRESYLRVRMTDVLQLPSEAQWIDGNLRTVIAALRRQWRDDVSDADARARSNWLLQLMDLRGWAHRAPPEQSDPVERRVAQLMLLTQLPQASRTTRERYTEWFEEAVLSQVREEEPRVYERIILTASELVDAAKEAPQSASADESAGSSE